MAPLRSTKPSDSAASKRGRVTFHGNCKPMPLKSEDHIEVSEADVEQAKTKAFKMKEKVADLLG